MCCCFFLSVYIFFVLFFQLKCFSSVQDLLKHTPTSHPDHPLLQDALRISQNFLSSINEETSRRQSTGVKKGEVSLLFKIKLLFFLLECHSTTVNCRTMI